MADPAPAVAPVTAPLPTGATPPAPAPSVDPAVPPAGGPPSATELGGAQPQPVTPLVAESPKPGEPPKVAEAPVPTFDAAKLTLPEGMKADDPVFKTFAETFTDDKLDPQARGQKLLDIYKDAVIGMREATVKVWNDTNEAWKNEVRADAEIGGAKFEATKTTIAKAIDSLGPELSVAFRQGLDATGAGNHPAIWKGLAKMAALLTEGGHVSGSPPAAGKPSIKEAFYPNSPDMK